MEFSPTLNLFSVVFGIGKVQILNSEFHIFVIENLAVVKIKMLPILVSWLLISSALASSFEDCKAGVVTFTGFNIENVRDSDVHDFQDSLEHYT
jgi:hypothetical protein